MLFCSDVMGSTNIWVEKNIGGVSLFFNGDAGDINPIFSVACKDGPMFSGGPVIGKRIKQIWDTLKPSSNIEMAAFAHNVQMGETSLNLTFARTLNCSSGGPLDVCKFCEIMDCDANIHLPASWIEDDPKFSATRITVDGRHNIIGSIPGEALVEDGWWMRNETKKLGFDVTFLQGYTNNYLGYFAPPDEYDVGGYESLMTFWGIGTAEKVYQGFKDAVQAVAPQQTGPAVRSFVEVSKPPFSF
jgi:hypothetical protein